MRSFLVLALSLLTVVELLGSSAARLGGAALPKVELPWALAIAALLLGLAAFRESSVRAVSVSRFLSALAALACSGWAMYAGWEAYRKPLTPLIVEVSDASHPERSPRITELQSLELTERRYLARLAGKRRDFDLDIAGFLMVTTAGRYRFDLLCDDWCELKLDGETLLHGEGRSSASHELEPGARRFELEYRQGTGPASLALRWDPPFAIQLFPLESHLSGTLEALDETSFRFRAATRWVSLVLLVAWSGALSVLLVRGAESTRDWAEALASWWRSEPGSPTAIVKPATWLVCGSLVLVLGAFAQLRLPARLEALAREYAVNPRRGPFVLERVEAFPQYLFFLAALCLVVAVAFRLLASTALAEGRDFSRARLTLVAAIGAMLVWGANVSQSEWVRYGRPCYDGYCDYAERVREVMVAPSDGSWARLRSHLAGNYHANSPVGPVAIAAASLVLGQRDVVPPYRLLSALATLGTLMLLVVTARRELGLGTCGSLVAAFLFVASGSVQRSFLFPQTDAIAMFFFALGVERTLAWTRAPSAWRYLAAASAIALALLTKLSALPLAGIAFVLAARPSVKGWRRSTTAMRDVARAAMLIAPPVILTGAFVLALRTANNVRTELHRIETLDSRPSFHLVATLVTLLPLLVSLALTLRRRWQSRELLLLGATAIYLVGLWASGASGWERFYLNVMPLALPLAVGRLALLREVRAPATAAVLLTTYALAHAVRMLMHLYNGA